MFNKGPKEGYPPPAILRVKNFCEIKAIDEARAKKIIKWYEETHYEVSIGAGVGITLDPLSLIRLLDVFGNPKNIDNR